MHVRQVRYLIVSPIPDFAYFLYVYQFSGYIVLKDLSIDEMVGA